MIPGLALKHAHSRLLPIGSRIVFVGDSNSQNMFTAQNWTREVLATTGGKVFCPPNGNQAAAGTGSQYGIDHLSEVAAAAPNIVAVMYGTNDGDGAAAIQGRLRTLYDAYIAMGAKVIALGILPNNYGAMDPRSTAVNAWIASQLDVLFVRTDNLTGAATTGASDVHITVPQQISLASNFRNVLMPLLSAASIYDDNPASIGDMSFAGTGGTLGTNATGTVPTGWTLGLASGSGSATIAKTTQSGATAVQITVTGPSRYRLNRTEAVTYTTSNYFDGWAEVKITGDSPQTVSFLCGGRAQFEAVDQALDARELGTVQVWRPESSTLVSGGSSITPSFDISVAAGAVTTVTISRIVVQKR